MTANTANRRPAAADALLSIVLPVYNEQLVLAGLLDSLIEAAGETGLAYEIIFVNDGSTDDSPRILDRLAAENRQVRVVHLSRNFGHQAAVQAGLANARGDAVILMDSDMQDAPSAIPRFVAEWQAGHDVVYAIRTERKEGLLKRILFAGFYRLLARISTTRIPLDAGNFGLIDRRVVRQVVALSDRDRYYPGLRSWVGFRQKGIEVERNVRYDARPRVSAWGLLRLAKTAIFSFSYAPLGTFYLIALAAAALLTLAGGYALYQALLGHALAAGLVRLMELSLLVGLNAAGIAIVGEYLARIYDQVRARPIYLVDRRVNFETGSSRLEIEEAYREATALIAAAERDARRLLGDDATNRDGVDLEDREYRGLVEQVNGLLETVTAAAERIGDDSAATKQAQPTEAK